MRSTVLRDVADDRVSANKDSVVHKARGEIEDVGFVTSVVETAVNHRDTIDGRVTDVSDVVTSNINGLVDSAVESAVEGIQRRALARLTLH